ncbi:MAG TPA: hypothetical protein VF676_13120 [Flavobacterium sp.]
MKKLLLVFVLVIALNSCSVGEENNVTSYALLPVESVEIAETYALNETTEIMVSYRRPTDCYIFDGFYIQPNGYTFTVSVQAVELNESNCLDDSMTLFEVPLEFHPTTAGEYTLRFYAGSENNVPQFLEYHVNVE